MIRSKKSKTFNVSMASIVQQLKEPVCIINGNYLHSRAVIKIFKDKILNEMDRQIIEM
jgi:hypothetical protein